MNEKDLIKKFEKLRLDFPILNEKVNGKCYVVGNKVLYNLIN